MEGTIEVSGLRKHFGSTLALDGVSFTVTAGNVTGFVGPNGAGKSTTMRIILGLDAPDAGSCLIGGQRYGSLRHPLRRVGSLLDPHALQPGRSGWNHLLWLTHSQGLPARRVSEVVEQSGLGSAIRRKAGGYSLGMRQRLGLAAAMLGDPSIVMLDEPFNGLDPEGIVWIRSFLRSLAAEGRAILVSSHLMSELQDTASHLVVIGRGRLVADASVADLIAAASSGLVALRTSARSQALTALTDVGATVAGTGTETLKVSELDAAAIIHLLTARNVPVLGSLHSAGDAGGGVHGPHAGCGGVPRPVSFRGPAMTSAGPAYRSRLGDGRENFLRLVHAEWTKLRPVRSWVISLAVGIGLTIGMSVLVISGSHPVGSDGKPPFLPTGPGREAVADTYYFVRQSLAGDGTLTARVTSLVGALYPVSNPVGNQGCPPGTHRQPQSAVRRCFEDVTHSASGPPVPSPATLQPWAKAGLIVTASTVQGSPYAAVMATPGHGVRMQWDYTSDRAGLPGGVSAASPRWLRLKRSGDTVTALDSTDGKHWMTIGSAVLADLPSTVQVGLFVTAPQISVYHSTVAGRSGGGNPSLATATFDHVTFSHQGARGAWRTVQVAPEAANSFYPSDGGGATRSGVTFRVSGSGDIAPWVEGPGGPGSPGYPLEMALAGSFLGLLVIVLLATLFVTGEYQRGLMRTTLAARPRRGQVLAAKAIVVAGASFVVGLVAFTADLAVAGSMLRSRGNYIYPVSVLTQIRMVVGLALVLAVGAVLALSIAVVARRGVGVVAGLIVAFVLPPFLSGSAIFPDGLAEWVLRVTPAAGFAIEQSLPRYFQVSAIYTPVYGYYPLSPWAGFLVLCAYAAAALGLAAYLFRRRDA